MDNINIAGSIFIGIVSGILTSALINLIVQTFEKILLPWYNSLIYKGIIIEGLWKTTVNQVGVKEMTLRQKGYSIDGEIIIVKQPTGRDDRKLMVGKGFLRDNYFHFNYKVKDRTRFGSGSMIMSVKGDGKILEGHYVFVSAGGKVLAKEETWERIA